MSENERPDEERASSEKAVASNERKKPDPPYVAEARTALSELIDALIEKAKKGSLLHNQLKDAFNDDAYKATFDEKLTVTAGEPQHAETYYAIFGFQGVKYLKHPKGLFPPQPKHVLRAKVVSQVLVGKGHDDLKDWVKKLNRVHLNLLNRRIVEDEAQHPPAEGAPSSTKTDELDSPSKPDSVADCSGHPNQADDGTTSDASAANPAGSTSPAHFTQVDNSNRTIIVENRVAVDFGRAIIINVPPRDDDQGVADRPATHAAGNPRIPAPAVDRSPNNSQVASGPVPHNPSSADPLANSSDEVATRSTHARPTASDNDSVASVAAAAAPWAKLTRKGVVNTAAGALLVGVSAVAIYLLFERARVAERRTSVTVVDGSGQTIVKAPDAQSSTQISITLNVDLKSLVPKPDTGSAVDGPETPSKLDERLIEAAKLRNEGKQVEADNLTQKVVDEMARNRAQVAKNQAEGHRQLGASAYSQKKYDGSIQQYSDAAALDPTPSDFNEIGVAYFNKGDLDNALANYNKAMALAHKQKIAFAWPSNNAGNVYLEQSPPRPDLAIPFYDDALRIDDKLESAYNNRGNAHKLIGNYDQALKDYDKAIELAPAFALPYNGRGNTLYEKGEISAAIDAYSQAIKNDPEYALAIVNRGIAYFVQQDFDRAIVDFGRAIELTPITSDAAAKFVARARTGRGAAFNVLLQSEQAKADFLEASRLDPSSAIAAAGLGFAYAALDRPNEALLSFEDAIRRDPDYFVTYLFRANLYLQRQDFKNALQDAEATAKSAPKEPWAFVIKGLAHAGLGDEARTRTDFEQAAAAATDPAITSLAKALLNTLDKNYDAAIAELNALCSEDNKGALMRYGALEMRAKIYAEKHDWASAVADYDRAIALKPTVGLLMGRGLAYRQIPDKQENAIADFNEILRLDSRNLGALEARATVYFRLGKFEEASVGYKAMIGLKPDARTLATTYTNLGNCFANMPGNDDRAIAAYDQAIKLNIPESLRARLGRAEMLERRNDFAGAVVEYDAVLKAAPREFYIYGQRARALRALGKMDDAVSDTMTQIALVPRDAAVFDQLGDMYLAMGRYADAATQYALARDLDPPAPFAQFDHGKASEALKNYDEAIKDYQEALKTEASASSAALRLFRLRHRQNAVDAKAELEAVAAKLDREDGLSEMIEFYLGKRTADEIAAADDDQRCEKNYYIGNWHQLQGRNDAAINAYNDALKSCSKAGTTYYDVKIELKQLP